MNDLIDTILNSNISMCSRDRFDMINSRFNDINQIEGDIVECGVWKGGMSIFLASRFADRHVWVCDSFEGFQPYQIAKYSYAFEDIDTQNENFGSEIRISLEEVKDNFKNFGYANDDRITFLKGWVKDTLPKSGIEKIALLRIDVDAYSATREVLDELYDKVQPGGFIIFDDSCLCSTVNALWDFCEVRNIKMPLLNTSSEQVIYLDTSMERPAHCYNLPCGCYTVKPY